MPITGNKGEWSEVYVLFRLLGDGRLYSANANFERDDTAFFPVIKVLRNEPNDKHYEYKVKEQSVPKTIEIYLNDTLSGTFPQERFSREADALLRSILSGTKAFSVPETEEFMHAIGCYRLAAPSTDKTDITLQIHDIKTGFAPICGFSIKSELGGAPTLINASGSTNFVYSVGNIDAETVALINSCNTKTKIQDRMKLLQQRNANIRFLGPSSSIFTENLMMIDTRFGEMLAEAIKIHFFEDVGSCLDVVNLLQQRDPLHLNNRDIYAHKFKQFLYAAALGMTPSTHWDGIDDANGGYIVVTARGDVLTYYVYNKNYFEAYLLNNTRFERASTTRHNYASIYSTEAGSYCLNLNLQIRFTR